MWWRRCGRCRRLTLVSRDLVWASRALGLTIVCRTGRGCQRQVITLPLGPEEERL